MHNERIKCMGTVCTTREGLRRLFAFYSSSTRQLRLSPGTKPVLMGRTTVAWLETPRDFASTRCAMRLSRDAAGARIRERTRGASGHASSSIHRVYPDPESLR